MSLEQGGGESGFTLTKAHSAIYRVAFRRRREFDPLKKWRSWWKDCRYLSLTEFVSRFPDLAIAWQGVLPSAVIILVRRRGSNCTRLLFDGRLWAVQAANLGQPANIIWRLEADTGKFKCQYSDLRLIPAIRLGLAGNQQGERQSLCELVGLPAGSFPDPQNLYDLRKQLTDFGRVGPDKGVMVVTGVDRDVCFSSGCQFVVEAKVDVRGAIWYQNIRYRPVKPLRPPLSMDAAAAAANDNDKTEEEQRDQKRAEMCQANRASATSVRLSGLNLAFSLGVISFNELVDLSGRLGQTSASLVMHLDEMGHLRHIYYRDLIESFGQVVTCFEEESENPKEAGCADEAVRNMNTFWDKVWDRRRVWGVPARASILRDVIERLERLVSSSGRTQFDICLRDLKRCILYQHVVFFSTKEEQIHSVKFFLAHYACKILKVRRGLQLKTSCNNDINALVVSDQLSLFNLQIYAGVDEDVDFFGKEKWMSPPEIVHRIRNVRNQRPAIFSLVLSRARVFAFVNEDFWMNFGRESVAHFGIDVHGNGAPFRSAALLAFECVWKKFAQLGGPLVQGPEKMKPFYAKMLRSASRGGFMYSAQTLMEGGESCSDGPQSVMEFDICSAYGFSASSALMPSGFCNGFVNLSGEDEDDAKEEEEEEDAVPVLEKTDPIWRHKTFEFKAVYFTLRRLGSTSRSDIRTVFSNFSPSGLFLLDKYPADLVVVFENGDIKVFQFDGHFVHGCDLCSNQPTSSSSSSQMKFANGQTHEEVRQKTRRRDRAFEQWAFALNATAAAAAAVAGGSFLSPKVEYHVITDCHSLDYSSRGLDKAFETDSVLRQLVVSYETVGGENGFGSKKRKWGEKGGQLTLQSWRDFMNREENNASFTCIAWLRGHCQQKDDIGCLVTYPPPDSDGYGGGCLLSSTATEPVALNRDYYQYLTSHHAFVATKLEAVLFFKAEPILNRIFRELVYRRRFSRDPREANWIKRLVNLSCGFFGLHRFEESTGLGRRNFSIRCKVPKGSYNVSTHRIELQSRLTCLDNTDYFVISLISHRNRRTVVSANAANSALALFFTVVEMGKLRLVQILQFISRHVSPQRWTLLYSNVDNMIIALNGASNLDEAVLRSPDRHGYLDYVIDKCHFLSGEPGCLKMVWLCNSASWKFVTAGLQQYVLREDSDNDDDGGGGGRGGNSGGKKAMQRQKNAGLNNLTNKKAFELACFRLFGGQNAEATMTVCQDRRINKLQSTSTRCQTLVLHRLPRRLTALPDANDDDNDNRDDGTSAAATTATLVNLDVVNNNNNNDDDNDDVDNDNNNFV